MHVLTKKILIKFLSVGKKSSKSVRKRFDINVLKAYEEKNKKRLKRIKLVTKEERL